MHKQRCGDRDGNEVCKEQGVIISTWLQYTLSKKNLSNNMQNELLPDTWSLLSWQWEVFENFQNGSKIVNELLSQEEYEIRWRTEIKRRHINNYYYKLLTHLTNI